MDTVDITPTPEACRQIARLFRAQRADAEALAARALDALDALDGTADDSLDALDGTADDALAPWGHPPRRRLRGAARRRTRASAT